MSERELVVEPLPQSRRPLATMPLRRRAARIEPWTIAVVVGSALLASLTYFGADGWGDAVEQRALTNAIRLLEIESRLGLDVEAAVQGSWLGSGAVGAALTVAYVVLYWPFLALGVVATLWRRRRSFRLLRNALALSGAVGVLVIAAVPVAPPRLLAGFEDHAAAAPLAALAHPSGWFNPYAAMPSFHVCWTLLAGLALRHAGAGPSAWLPPTVMVLAVVTTGNHFVLDVVAGAGLAVLAWAAARPMQQALDAAAERDARRRRLAATARAGRGAGPGPTSVTLVDDGTAAPLNGDFGRSRVPIARSWVVRAPCPSAT